MQLRRLQGLEREKIEEEHKALMEKIAYFKTILADENKLLGVIKDEILATKSKYADPRRTKIVNNPGDIDIEDLIEDEVNVITLTHRNYVKRTPLDNFKSQNRGGKGVKCYKITEKTGDVVGMKAVDEDSEIMMINTEGIVIRMKCSDISVYGRITSGVKLINLPENEKVASIAKVRKASAEIDGEEIEISEDEEETETPIEE